MKPTNPWADAHTRLKQLYDERVPSGMTQKEFGRQFGIGTQSMVAQYLNGTRPLNFEAAAKFAMGLRCTIHDISPEMAAALETDIFPVLGKVSAASKMAWRRLAAKAAMVLLVLLGTATPPPARADVGFSSPIPRLCIMLNLALCRLIAFTRLYVRFLTSRARFSTKAAPC